MSQKQQDSGAAQETGGSPMWAWAVGTIFALTIIANVIFVTASIRNRHNLVTPDYYAQSLRYDDRILAARSADSIGIRMRFEENRSFSLYVGEWASADGDVRDEVVLEFYRPDAAELDTSLRLDWLDASNSGGWLHWRLPQMSLRHGHWELRLLARRGGLEIRESQSFVAGGV